MVTLAACSASQPPASPPPPRVPVLIVPSRHIAATPKFDWPITSGGKLSSKFGLRHGAMHEGVDIAAPVGTPVRAAAAGWVIFVGRMRGYGNLVIVQHDRCYVTVYAHESCNLVREGQAVKRGQLIGRVGRTGHCTGANLHFEVRRYNVATNPLAYLPPVRVREFGETRLAAGTAY
jgi:murein DD-endopeptidase MepM/ murein hydrolase activator NlpD